jgi:predicted adenylyl cyclase CyaB
MQKEIRATIDDPEAVAGNLIERAGARELDIEEQHDTYYGSIKLYEELDRSFLVRVRRGEGTSRINYKSQVEEGMWEEHKTIVNDPEEADRVFAGMGLDQVLTVQKVRRSFSHEGMHVHVDSVEELGHFIEVKFDPDSHDRQDVVELFESVGVDEDRIIETGYVSELLRRKQSDYADWCST